jgi:beta-glucosidase
MTSAGPISSADVSSLARRFPPGFAWGAATAAYQVEGAPMEDGRGPSIWDTFSRLPRTIAGGDTGDVACDHYHRWGDDVDLMADLGLTAYRFSVAWPRIQPDGVGAPNVAGLDFYDRLVDGVLERGIDPWLTLYHWDLPQALEDRGGWPAREIVGRFADYAEVVAARLGDRVRNWITINEPEIIARQGYAEGIHAPGRRDWAAALRAAHHLQLAHRRAAEAIQGIAPSARIGMALNLAPVVPASESEADVAAAALRDAALNGWYLDPLFGRGYPAPLVAEYGALLSGLDLAEMEAPESGAELLGINYYSRERIRHDEAGGPLRIGGGPALLTVTAMDWEVYPAGLTEILRRVHSDYAPAAMAVTENGAAYEDVVVDGTVADAERRAYLIDHLAAAADAIEAGVPLIGYFAWSLLDNFEWAFGYRQRFGIIRVDYATQQRTVKASGEWYRSLLAAHRRST